jgi:hypothetical protein
MGQGHVWLYPVQAVFFERQLTEERRPQSERVDGRTNVMSEAWQRKFRRTNAAANGLSSFHDEHGKFCLGKTDGRGEAVGPEPMITASYEVWLGTTISTLGSETYPRKP